MEAVERQPLATAAISGNAGHSLHIGTPRESFVKGFLRHHLSENLAIGTGEIIDAASQPRERRKQIDVVLYKRTYPKLLLGGGIGAYLRRVGGCDDRGEVDVDRRRSRHKRPIRAKRQAASSTCHTVILGVSAFDI